MNTIQKYCQITWNDKIYLISVELHEVCKENNDCTTKNSICKSEKCECHPNSIEVGDKCLESELTVLLLAIFLRFSYHGKLVKMTTKTIILFKQKKCNSNFLK